MCYPCVFQSIYKFCKSVVVVITKFIIIEVIHKIPRVITKSTRKAPRTIAFPFSTNTASTHSFSVTSTTRHFLIFSAAAGGKKAAT